MKKNPPLQNTDTFHKVRSRLIDAFAKLEQRVALALHSAGKPVKGDTLGAKLTTLKAQPGHVEANYDRLAELVKFRADLVHGVMTFVDKDGERFACFRNARNVILQVQPASLVNYRSLKEMAEEIERLSSAFD
ncbi:hypothetical protein SZ64_05555 [Erythrobacter sp. SG61-1L]|uniref:hypothetical protein n=1 Tax=Erythrobacter sp. SG61-1L TaxID=1603897 RepID=UPI0006C9194A|nr:hypothetical protein [Erythrobacter sp. SG61-1L]KPL67624.1 hypothetical protein SZ64_05555 [Erythrobacter sp. SG61-1L]